MCIRDRCRTPQMHADIVAMTRIDLFHMDKKASRPLSRKVSTTGANITIPTKSSTLISTSLVSGRTSKYPSAFPPKRRMASKAIVTDTERMKFRKDRHSRRSSDGDSKASRNIFTEFPFVIRLEK